MMDEVSKIEIELNKVYNMDCLDGMEMMDANSVNLVVTDPPYDVGYDKKLEEYKDMGEDLSKGIPTPNLTYKSRDIHYIEFKNFNYMRFAFGLKGVMKNNAHAYIFCGDNQLFKWHKTLTYAGFKFNDILIWVKNRQTFDLSHGYHYSYRHEYCMLWSKGSRKLSKAGLCSVMNYDVLKDYVHPTQKPLEMIDFLILNSSKEGDTVLDPFMGSGTTAVSAKRLGRKFIGFELSPEFCDICNKRIDGTYKKADLFSFNEVTK